MTRTILFGGQEAAPPCEPPTSDGPARLHELLGQLSWKYVTPEATFPATYEIPTDPDELAEDIAHWAGKVWLREHELPTGTALADFDLLSLEPDFRRYVEANGGGLFEQGLTIDEVWASQTLFDGAPTALFVNQAYADLPLERIEPKRLCSSQALVWLQAAIQFTFPFGIPWNVLVSNGRTGHTIGIAGVNGVAYRHPRQVDVPVGWFSFHDPWPARSLLCAERHDFDVHVVEDVANPPFWLISPEDLDRIIVGFLVPVELLPRLQQQFLSLDLAETQQHRDGRPLWLEDSQQPDAYFPLLIADNGGSTPSARETADGLARLNLLTD